MKSYSPYLLLLCFNIQFGICQLDLVGQVIDADTEEPLPYVNIGLVNQNIGTVTDEAGYFELEVPGNGFADATLRFSMIGFEPQDFTLQEYRDQKILTIPLKEKATALEEVVLTTKKNKYQTKILGNKTTSQLIYAAFTTNKLGNEMGFLVRGRKNPMILKKFNVSLVENDYGPIRFRLNFYDLKDGLPNETLLNENIIVETDIQSGIVSKDLTPYEIVIDQDFFVAIEWIEDLGLGKLFFSGGFFGSPLIAREVSQGTWSKVGSASVGMNVEVRY
ncbi:MAG: carboxypeptidase-like regulatory domain-containing protein [Flavobacteriaceae bacterium]|nr:carboxypeptidase-like regulatory domain-containing protein [Flavobacteriaceae bacterium]